MSSSIEVDLAQISSFGTFPGRSGCGWVGGWGEWAESIKRLISAEAEAEALLGNKIPPNCSKLSET